MTCAGRSRRGRDQFGAHSNTLGKGCNEGRLRRNCFCQTVELALALLPLGIKIVQR